MESIGLHPHQVAFLGQHLAQLAGCQQLLSLPQLGEMNVDVHSRRDGGNGNASAVSCISSVPLGVESDIGLLRGPILAMTRGREDPPDIMHACDRIFTAVQSLREQAADRLAQQAEVTAALELEARARTHAHEHGVDESSFAIPMSLDVVPVKDPRKPAPMELPLTEGMSRQLWRQKADMGNTAAPGQLEPHQIKPEELEVSLGLGSGTDTTSSKGSDCSKEQKPAAAVPKVEGRDSTSSEEGTAQPEQHQGRPSGAPLWLQLASAAAGPLTPPLQDRSSSSRDRNAQKRRETDAEEVTSARGRQLATAGQVPPASDGKQVATPLPAVRLGANGAPVKTRRPRKASKVLLQVGGGGYRWCKYGEKHIKECPGGLATQRSYYRCASARDGCMARMHVDHTQRGPACQYMAPVYTRTHNHPRVE